MSVSSHPVLISDRIDIPALACFSILRGGPTPSGSYKTLDVTLLSNASYDSPVIIIDDYFANRSLARAAILVSSPSNLDTSPLVAQRRLPDSTIPIRLGGRTRQRFPCGKALQYERELMHCGRSIDPFNLWRRERLFSQNSGG